MSRLVVFLRAVNTMGRSMKMEPLQEAFVELGFAGVQTYLANGNVIIESKRANGLALEQRIDRKLLAAFGDDVVSFVRSLDELSAMPAAVPFAAAERARAAAVQVGMLKQPPAADAVKRLAALQTPNDSLAVSGRELYWLMRTKQPDAPVTQAAIEKALGMPTTLRALSMVERMVVEQGAGSAEPAAGKS